MPAETLGRRPIWPKSCMTAASFLSASGSRAVLPQTKTTIWPDFRLASDDGSLADDVAGHLGEEALDGRFQLLFARGSCAMTVPPNSSTPSSRTADALAEVAPQEGAPAQQRIARPLSPG